MIKQMAPNGTVSPKVVDGTADPGMQAAICASLYAQIATAFYHPDTALAASIVAGNVGDTVVALVAALVEKKERKIAVSEDGDEWDALIAAAVALQAALKPYASGDETQLLHEMKVEYARLFIGPGAAVVSPYETIQVAVDAKKAPPLMVSAQAIAVENAFREAGLMLAKGHKEPPDHFATEVEFMYYLSQREADALRQSDDTSAIWRQRKQAFLERHLGAWTELFCRKVEEKTAHPFYAAAATFARTWIVMEGRARAYP